MIERGVTEYEKDQINQAIHKYLPDFEITRIQLEMGAGASEGNLFVDGRTNSSDPGKITNAEEELQKITYVQFAFVTRVERRDTGVDN